MKIVVNVQYFYFSCCMGVMEILEPLLCLLCAWWFECQVYRWQHLLGGNICHVEVEGRRLEVVKSVWEVCLIADHGSAV
jgi:hypothetical protein